MKHLLREIGLAVVLAALLPIPAWAALDLRACDRQDARDAIHVITRQAIHARLAGQRYLPGEVPPALAQPAGLFVTFSRNGVTRGCWGAIAARHGRLADDLAETAGRALTFDGRQSAIKAHELEGLVAHVSIVGTLHPVTSVGSLRPRREGLFVTAPGKGGVLLPGEAATGAWQVATCRRKAGLRPRESARMYRFQTVVIGPIPVSNSGTQRTLLPLAPRPFVCARTAQ